MGVPGGGQGPGCPFQGAINHNLVFRKNKFLSNAGLLIAGNTPCSKHLACPPAAAQPQQRGAADPSPTNNCQHCQPLTAAEQQTQLSLWSIFASPLMLSKPAR